MKKFWGILFFCLNAVLAMPQCGFIINDNVTDASCYGYTDGAITLSISGGTSPYTFIWSNGATTQNISGVAAGNYSLTITDASPCTETYFASVNQPSKIIVSGNTQNETCEQSNGFIDVTVQGGVSPYSYSWNTGDASEDLNNIPSGSYNVTVTDNIGCFETAPFTIQRIENITVINTSVTNTDCNASNGKIEVTSVETGTAPINYSIDGINYSTSNVFENLSKGVYSVYVVDNLGCKDTTQVIVKEPESPSVVSSVDFPPCAETGTVTFSKDSSGAEPFTYSVDGSDFSSENTYEMTAGVHSVVVQDANLCYDTLEIVLANTCPEIKISVMFSPNGDGINDYWTILNIDQFPKNQVNVYDRWGQLVYRKNNYDNSWDGKVAGKIIPASGYYYVVYLDKDNPDVGTYTGSLDILK